MIKKNSSIPIKEQLKNFIIKGISDGKFAEGQKIPSINAIANEFKVARETVRMTFESLVQEGYIIPEHGKGYFVKPKEKRKARITLLAKLDGVYVRPIYDGIISVLGQNTQLFLIDLNHELSAIKAVIENLAYNQTTDYLLVVPPRGLEETFSEMIDPFRRYFKIAWLDRAPTKSKDSIFIADYKQAVKLVTTYFVQSKNQMAYFSRNEEDKSVFSTMRKEFFKQTNLTKTNCFYQNSDKCIADIKKNKIKYIFCETDTEAIYLLSACLLNGLKPLDDFQLMGCDNTWLSDLMMPAITSVDPGFFEMGSLAGKWVLSDTLTHHAEVVTTTPKIIHKGTTKI